MSMILQFAPWIAFTLLSNVDWRLALAVGLVAQILVIVAHRPIRVGVLNGAMILFFLVVGAFALLVPDAAIKDHVSVLSTAWLAVVATGSLLVGRPFTLDFSRHTVSPEIAASPRFMRTNRVITGVWAEAFAAMALGGVVAIVTGISWVSTATTVVVLVLATKFSTSYPQQVRAAARAEAAAVMSDGAVARLSRSS